MHGFKRDHEIPDLAAFFDFSQFFIEFVIVEKKSILAVCTASKELAGLLQLEKRTGEFSHKKRSQNQRNYRSN